MKDFLVGIAPGSDSDLLHLSEGSSDFIGLSFMDIPVDVEKEEQNGK